MCLVNDAVIMDRGACYATTAKLAAGRTDVEAGRKWWKDMLALQLPKLIPLRGGSLLYSL